MGTCKGRRIYSRLIFEQPDVLKSLRLGAFTLPNNLFVAPMAGVTDRPFRVLCRSLGAGHAVSEMVTSKRELWNSLKTSRVSQCLKRVAVQ